jgi:bifunctional DNA-binding transcriptional regulator/antitoxin component of YhaV-PrlF toxin-antitoxin module
MTEVTITIDSQGRASLHIPAYLRDKYKLQNKQKAWITDHNGMILIDLNLENEKI